MSIDYQLERAEWIRMHLSRVPDLILHVRLQRLPSLPASGTKPKISGSSDRARPPMQLDPIDDADKLWAAVCLVALELEQHTQERAPIEFALQRVTTREGGRRFVQGFSTSDPYFIELQAVRVVGWLKASAVTLALSDIYKGAVDHLVKTVGELRGKYPEAPRPPVHRMRCPKCGQRAVVKVYNSTGEIKGLHCEACGAHRDF